MPFRQRHAWPAALAALAAAAPAPAAEPATPAAFVRLADAASDEVWVREDADLSIYTAVFLAPITVTPKPDQPMAGFGVDLAEEIEPIARAIFREVLAEGEGYALVDELGPEVLEVRAAFVDVVLPPRRDEPSATALVRPPPSITLTAVLRDGASGRNLATIRDTVSRDRAAYDPGTIAAREAEFRELLRSWARRLRAVLDGTRGGP